MTHTRNTRRGRHAAASIIISLVALTACSDDDMSSASESAATDKPATVELAPSETSAGNYQSVSGGAEVASANTVPAVGGVEPVTRIPTQVIPSSDRKLIVVMTIGLEVPDAAAAVDKVITLAAAHGGQLYNSSLDLTTPEFAAGDLVFKLPPAEVDAFLRGLEPAIGRRTGLQGTTDDVTTRIADLDAQILTAYTSVGRIRALLGEAKDLGEVITLEGELSARETRLEQLLAQQTGLSSQVALATITVHLTTAPIEAKAVPVEVEKKKDDTISAAFSKGWKSFVAVLVAFALLIGYSAPFLLIGGIVLLVTMRITRRRARSSQSRSAAPPHPPAPDAGPHTSTPDFVDAARNP